MEIKILEQARRENLETEIKQYIQNGYRVHWETFTVSGNCGYGTQYNIIVYK